MCYFLANSAFSVLFYKELLFEKMAAISTETEQGEGYEKLIAESEAFMRNVTQMTGEFYAQEEIEKLFEPMTEALAGLRTVKAETEAMKQEMLVALGSEENGGRRDAIRFMEANNCMPELPPKPSPRHFNSNGSAPTTVSPKNQPPANASATTSSEGLAVSSLGNSDRERDISAEMNNNPNKPANLTAGTLKYCVPLTAAEYEEVPKFLRNRIPVSDANAVLAKLNELIKEKYGLMRMPMAKVVSKTDKDRVIKWKEQETSETTGGNLRFVSEDELRVGLSGNGRAIQNLRYLVPVMRHCKRIRELRSNKLTRLIVLPVASGFRETKQS